jgi:hypothetical protein
MLFASTDLLSNSACELIGVDFISKTDGIPAIGARTRPADNPSACGAARVLSQAARRCWSLAYFRGLGTKPGSPVDRLIAAIKRSLHARLSFLNAVASSDTLR